MQSNPGLRDYPPDDSIHDKITAYAAQLRAALGLDGGSSSTLHHSEGRLQFVGVKRRAEKQTVEGQEVRPAQRARAEEVIAGWEHLPTEILEAIYMETLFPHTLLHMNQFAGRKETRIRWEFEEHLAMEMQNHHEAYASLASVFGRAYYAIVNTPRMRTALYTKWMATPPEGLYELPDPGSAVPPHEFSARVKLADYPLVGESGGETAGLLRNTWYRDFLTTVAYNEWQRALSLSSARASQLLFWLHQQQEIQYSDIPRKFARYWGLEDDRAMQVFQQSRVNPRGMDIRNLSPTNPQFWKDDFPLTFDIDTFRMFRVKLPTIPNPPYALMYQSFNQIQLRAMHMNPRDQWSVVPQSRELVSAFFQNQIELVRMVRFKNVQKLSRIYDRAEWNRGGGFPRPPTTAFINMVSRQRPGSPANQAALMVDSPYDLAITTSSAQPQTPTPRHSFMPWAGGQTISLTNIGLNRITGMDQAYKDIKKETGTEQRHPTHAMSLNVFVSEQGKPVFYWSSQSYTYGF